MDFFCRSLSYYLSAVSHSSEPVEFLRFRRVRKITQGDY